MQRRLRLSECPLRAYLVLASDAFGLQRIGRGKSRGRLYRAFLSQSHLGNCDSGITRTEGAVRQRVWKTKMMIAKSLLSQFQAMRGSSDCDLNGLLSGCSQIRAFPLTSSSVVGLTVERAGINSSRSIPKVRVSMAFIIYCNNTRTTSFPPQLFVNLSFILALKRQFVRSLLPTLITVTSRRLKAHDFERLAGFPDTAARLTKCTRIHMIYTGEPA
jgi:hypothetical protein